MVDLLVLTKKMRIHQRTQAVTNDSATITPTHPGNETTIITKLTYIITEVDIARIFSKSWVKIELLSISASDRLRTEGSN